MLPIGTWSWGLMLGVVPHDIDWVKDRVRWYWETKLFKSRRAHVTPAADHDVQPAAGKEPAPAQPLPSERKTEFAPSAESKPHKV